MKIFQGLFLTASLFYQNGYAGEALSAPTGQSPQCERAYESAGEIKTINNVFNTLSSACHDAGGMKLMHRVLVSENNNEPTGVLFTCTGSNQNYVVLSCLFPTSLDKL